MFNMVCRWPWGLFGRPVGRHIYFQFHYIARVYVFVDSTMVRQKKINEQHIFLCQQQYMCCLYLNFAGRFTSFRHVLSACGRAAPVADSILFVRLVEQGLEWTVVTVSSSVTQLGTGRNSQVDIHNPRP